MVLLPSPSLFPFSPLPWDSQARWCKPPFATLSSQVGILVLMEAQLPSDLCLLRVQGFCSRSPPSPWPPLPAPGLLSLPLASSPSGQLPGLDPFHPQHEMQQASKSETKQQGSKARGPLSPGTSRVSHHPWLLPPPQHPGWCLGSLQCAVWPHSFSGCWVTSSTNTGVPISFHFWEALAGGSAVPLGLLVSVGVQTPQAVPGVGFSSLPKF